MAGMYAIGTAFLPPPLPSNGASASALSSAATSSAASVNGAAATVTGGGGGGGGGIASLSNAPTGALGTSLEGLRTLVNKRKTAWTYLKNAADGRVYWFNTILLTDDDLRIAFPNDKMRNRTTRFSVLGMSLSSVLDIAPAHDFLRGLLALTQDFDAMPEDRFGGKNQQPRSLFKVGSKSRRGVGGMSGSVNGNGGGGGAGDFGFSLGGDGGDGSMLFMPNIPFELDYLQVLITTCEILIEIYTKIGSYLGPSGSSSTSASSNGLFPQPPNPIPGGVPTHRGLGMSAGGGLGLSPALIDMVHKIDGRLKKLVSLLSKEIDTLARAAIKAELNSLGAVDFGLDPNE